MHHHPPRHEPAEYPHCARARPVCLFSRQECAFRLHRSAALLWLLAYAPAPLSLCTHATALQDASGKERKVPLEVFALEGVCVHPCSRACVRIYVDVYVCECVFAVKVWMREYVMSVCSW